VSGVVVTLVRLLALGSCGADRLQVHSADGTPSGTHLPDFRVHGAGVLNLSSRCGDMIVMRLRMMLVATFSTNVAGMSCVFPLHGSSFLLL
jgi:hypothetical protein